MFAAVISFAAFTAQETRAVPAFPRAVETTQPDGQKIKVQLRGDEYFSWNEDAAGYAIKRDTDGAWKYARPSANSASFEVIPSARVGKADPARLQLKPHALPSRELIRDRVLSARSAARGSSKNGDLSKSPLAGPSKADVATAPTGVEPPPSKIPVSGTLTIRNIVILAAFSDHWNAGAGTVYSSYGRVDTNEYNNLFNQVGYTTDGAVGSVRDYYSQVSYGKLTIETIVTSWVQLPQTESYYGSDSPSQDYYWKTMITDAINAADTAGFNFAQGDSDSDGWVDCLTVIHSGHGQEYGSNPSTCIWSKQGEMSSPVTKDGVQMKRVHTEPALRGTTSNYTITRIGVVCHEMGHFFGLPDLYDYSGYTGGIGSWGLMASGSWNGSDGKSPAHFCAWSKYMLGFVKPVEIHSASSLSLPKVETNAAVHMIRDGTANGEYFLVENRAKTGFDNAAEIYPGMLIYHIDADSGDNDWSSWDHPAVKIEEGDGDDTLGSNVYDSEAGDVWTSTNGLAGGFRDATDNLDTNAMLYQGSDHYYDRANNGAYYTYNRLNGFSAAGDTMTYSASTLRPTVTSQTGVGSSYTVGWGACTNATQYEIQEGSPVIATSFTDGAESSDDMYAKWDLSGTVARSNSGAHSGSYSYAMNRYFDYNWGSSVQSLTMKTPFKVTASTAVSFYMMSHLGSGYGYLRCQISNNNGDTWHTLGSYSGYIDPWTQITYNYAAISSAGISLNDQCILRFVANYEYTSGWDTYPGFGYAVDDISISNTEINSYGSWTTLSNSVGTNSYAVTGRSGGVHAYQVRSLSNGSWQAYGPVGTVTVNASYTLTYTAGSGGTISGTSPQTVSSGGSGSTVTAIPNTGYHFVQWSDGIGSAARTDTNVTGNINVTAIFAINTYTLTYTPGVNGSITGPNPQTVNYGTSGQAVTAVPDGGAYFLRWSDGSTANPRTDANVTANLSVTAIFLQYTSPVWVLFGYSGTELGTSDNPFNTLAEGLNGVTNGGTIRIFSSSMASGVRITKQVRLEALNGTVTIGRSTGSPAPVKGNSGPIIVRGASWVAFR